MRLGVRLGSGIRHAGLKRKEGLGPESRPDPHRRSRRFPSRAVEGFNSDAFDAARTDFEYLNATGRGRTVAYRLSRPEMNCLVFVAESDVEVSEESRLPKESKRHIIPCMRIEHVRRKLNSVKLQARSVEVC